MIYTVTFNPALDYRVDVESLKLGETNRSVYENFTPGGKGLNVAAVLNSLGKENIALGFIAGFTGNEIKRRFEISGGKSDFIELKEGESRINVKIKAETETEINAKGPIIDEASMLNIKLVNWINKFCLKHEIKVMYIGDASQLFPVKEKVSYAFKVATKTYYLREVVRQGANNPISKLLDLLREDINHTHSWKFLEYINLHKHEVNETGAGFTVCGKKDFINIVNNCFSDEEYTKNID